MALLPATPLNAALEIAERLRLTVERLDLGDLAPGLAVAISIGIAGLAEGSSASTLLQRADEALYRAKEAGRNRVEVAHDAA